MIGNINEVANGGKPYTEVCYADFLYGCGHVDGLLFIEPGIGSAVSDKLTHRLHIAEASGLCDRCFELANQIAVEGYAQSSCSVKMDEACYVIANGEKDGYVTTSIFPSPSQAFLVIKLARETQLRIEATTPLTVTMRGAWYIVTRGLYGPRACGMSFTSVEQARIAISILDRGEPLTLEAMKSEYDRMNDALAAQHV